MRKKLIKAAISEFSSCFRLLANILKEAYAKVGKWVCLEVGRHFFKTVHHMLSNKMPIYTAILHLRIKQRCCT